ncbi:hypothetical protein ACIP98_38275 [Streptomyces sp. NPDC088354]|uniref:hypothetical protein n=1 Tax=Streptomyces sp. NPDC088354 TaxID=3365856 RepID=UPI00381291A9
MPTDEASLLAMCWIASGESRARLYVAAGEEHGSWLRLCLRGTPGAVLVTGSVASHAEPLLRQIRQAMLRTAERHRAAGDTEEAQRWRQMARKALRARQSADKRRHGSVRTVSGGLPTLGQRRQRPTYDTGAAWCYAARVTRAGVS